MDFWTSVDDQLNIEVRFTASDDYTLGFIFWFGICSLQILTQDCKLSAFKTSDSLSAGVFSKS